MRPLMELVDVVIANEEDIQSVLGFEVHGTDVTTGQLNLEAYKATAAADHRRRSTARQVAITLRESHSASDNGWSAVIYDKATGDFQRSQHYDVRLVDRIGGGDSFAGGLILRPRDRQVADRRAAVRGGRERAQADHPRRLQPRTSTVGSKATAGTRRQTPGGRSRQR